MRIFFVVKKSESIYFCPGLSRATNNLEEVTELTMLSRVFVISSFMKLLDFPYSVNKAPTVVCKQTGFLHQE